MRRGRALPSILVAACAIAGCGGTAHRDDDAIARAALLRPAEIPGSWRAVPDDRSVASSSCGPAVAFRRAATARAVGPDAAEGGARLRSAVYLFRDARAAADGVRRVLTPDAARCEGRQITAEARKEAVKAGSSFRVGDAVVSSTPAGPAAASTAATYRLPIATGGRTVETTIEARYTRSGRGVTLVYATDAPDAQVAAATRAAAADVRRALAG